MHGLLSIGRDLVASARLHEWWPSKIPLLLACILYAALTRAAPDPALLARMLWLLLALCGYAAFGYSVNSFSDRFVDGAGKANPFTGMPESTAYAVMLAGLVVAFAPALIFSAVYAGTSVSVLFLASFGLAAAYSLAPVRLKERGFLGVLAAALAQRTLPAAIVFEAMGAWDSASVMLCLLSTPIGIRYMLVHQISDEAADRAAGVSTFATERGTPRLKRYIGRLVFPGELALLAVTLWLMSYTAPGLVPAVTLYLAWCALQIATRKDSGWSFASDTYRVLAPFYYLFLPVTLAVLLTAREPGFWPALLLTCIWTCRRFLSEFRILTKIIRGPGTRRRRTQI